MADWFEDWFNSEEYLFVYRHRNEEDAQKLFNLIINNTLLEKNSKVLDLACGAGRHSILFAKNKFVVTGIDISENLLCTAQRNAAELGLKINFIKADLRNIYLTDLVNHLTQFRKNIRGFVNQYLYRFNLRLKLKIFSEKNSLKPRMFNILRNVS